jgi:hypothetical protein
MHKNIREEEVFGLFYKEKSNIEIIGREKPDFHLRHKSGHLFGVEITDFFYNESSARSKLIPGYMTQILTSGTYRHKADITELPLKDAKYKSKNGSEEKLVKVIFSESKKFIDVLSSLNRTISQKNRSFHKYPKKFNHINLVIYDRENCLESLEEDKFFIIFLHKEITDLIRCSPYREIYFITKMKNNGLGYVPLKLFCWSSTLLTFKKIYLDYYKSKSDRNAENFFNHYYIYCSFLGISNIYVKIINPLHIFFENSSINVLRGKYEIVALQDELFPNDLQPLKNITTHKVDSEFLKYIKSFNQRQVGYFTLFVKLSNYN